MGAVSPNPGRGAIEVTVRFPADREVILAVYDLQGRRCRQIATEGTPGEARALSIDLSGLHAGVYFVRLADRHGTRLESRKVVVVR